MSSENSPTEESIPTMEITTIHTDNEPFIHVEHFFYIVELEKVGLKLNKTLLFYGVRLFFNMPQTIYPELVKKFWRNVEFLNIKVIVSKVLGVRVTLSSDSIAKATSYLHEGSTHHKG